MWLAHVGEKGTGSPLPFVTIITESLPKRKKVLIVFSVKISALRAIRNHSSIKKQSLLCL